MNIINGAYNAASSGFQTVSTFVTTNGSALLSTIGKIAGNIFAVMKPYVAPAYNATIGKLVTLATPHVKSITTFFSAQFTWLRSVTIG